MYYGNVRVLIVSGGLGKRFSDKGYTRPKPFLEMNGKQMIDVIVEQLPIGLKSIDILFSNAGLEYAPKNKNCSVMYVDRHLEQNITGLKGMAAGVLYTLQEKRNYGNDPILLLSCDQFITQETMCSFLQSCWTRNPIKFGGSLLTFSSTDPTDLKWSFCVKEKPYKVKRVVEKPTEYISEFANTGVYFFSDAELLKQAILKDSTAQLAKIGEETYIAPLYNHFIDAGYLIENYNITKGEQFIPLGVPEEFEAGIVELKKRGVI
jgi:dTDP-glucose pyrophosphorylase